MDCKHGFNRPFHVALLCLLALATEGGQAPAQSAADPVELQRNAIARIDRWLDHVLSTGDAATTQSDLAEAQAGLQTSYSLFLARHDLGGAAWSGIKLGDIQRYQNQWKSAIPVYQDAIKLAETAKRMDYQTKALSALGFSEMQAGSMDAAVDHAAEAARLGAHCGNVAFYFDALDRAGEIETKRGNIFAAHDYFESALLMRDQIQDSRLIYQLFWDRGEAYLEDARACDYKRGYDVCYELLKLAQADYQNSRAIAQQRGYLYFASIIGDSQQTGEAIRTSIQRAQSQNQNLAATSMFNPKMPKDVLVNEAFAPGPLAPGDLALVENAVADLRGWLARMQQQGLIIQDLNPTDLYVQGLRAESKGDSSAALAKYLEAVQLLAQDRRSLRDEQARSAFMEDKMSFYYSPAQILLQQKRAGEAFDLFEQSRSRALADLLASRPPTLGSPQDRALFSELQSQSAKIAALQKKLFDLTGSPDRDENGKSILDLEAEIAGLQQDFKSLELKIAGESQRLSSLTSSKSATLEAVQHEAAEGGYDLLYYVVLDTNVIIWHISGSAVEVKCVFLPHPVLALKVAALHDALVAPRDAPGAQFSEGISRQLYLYLIQPVAEHIKSDHLVIIPQEELTAIPFQALQNPGDGKYLGERFSISYAPSATILSTLARRPSLKDGRLLAIADPDIHDAADEVRSIGLLYPGRARLVTDEPVKKQQVGAWVGQYNLVHLSVHGKFNSNDPLLSYLQFTSSPPDDGRLTAAEMFGLPLQKNSVLVLSACETGRAQATHSGELLGMERSLIYAGAGSLVLSSWEVNAASTKLWMETFYREGQTKDPAEAARLALLAVKSQPAFSHPFYWSPFLMVGK
jgi:CHAT domain-containing protein/tetratricopeptide (TPR) repeat protein